MPVTVDGDVPDRQRDGDRTTVNIQVMRPPPRTYTFEDVHFDFDRYSLRPEATRVLDEAVDGDAAGRDAAADDRRAHVQHRHGGIQPGARRAARERGAGLPDEPRHQRRPAADDQLRERPSCTTTRGRNATAPTGAPR